MKGLAGRVALVTGGASGIGASVVARLRAEGVVALAADIASNADISLDVSDAAACAAAVAEAVRLHGRLDLMVNSAGIGVDIPFLDTTPEQFDRIMAVNLRGTFLIGQAAARAMQPGSAIVNLASVSAFRGNFGRSAYGASKGGVVVLTQVMACELAPLGIRVNAIAPGPITSPMTAHMHDPESTAAFTRMVPMGRYGTPEEVAAAAAFLCSEDASYITGHTLPVEGGFLAGGMRRG